MIVSGGSSTFPCLLSYGRLLLVVGIVFLQAVAWSQACSPPVGNETQEPVSLTALAIRAETVLTGKVLRTLPGRVGWPDSYDVDVEVDCVFKGPNAESIPKEIRIEGAGSIPGVCNSYNFEVGASYIFFLKAMDGNFRPIYPPENGTGHYLDEFIHFCSMQRISPQGVPTDKCPDKTEECAMEADFPMPANMPAPGDTPALPPVAIPPPPPKDTGHAVKTKPDNKGTAYESVKEEQTNKEDGGSDSAASLSWSLLVLLPVTALLYIL